MKETMFDHTHRETEFETYERGAIEMPDGRLCIGRVGAPPQQEATSEQFYFWVTRNALVEKTQLVTCKSQIGEKSVTFYAIVDEVYRRSRKRNMGEEVDEQDGDPTYEPPFESEGITYASASILHTEPPVLTPPRERSDVILGGEDEAVAAYGYAEMARPMAVGRLRNGGDHYAGLAKIDLAYLLGDNGGHLNVTGMAGVGTKSSFLLTVVKLLLHEAQPKLGQPPLHIVPIVLNVKGEDLMWIDRPNRDFREKHRADWDALGVEPRPFEGATFYAPTEPGTDGAPTIDGCNANAYSWSLSDVLAGELFRYLFSDDTTSPVMMALVYDIVAHLTQNDGRLKPDAPARTWQELLKWIREQAARRDADRDVPMHQTGTWRAVYRRLWDILTEGKSIFPPEAHSGCPLSVTRDKNSPPQVIDIHDLPASLQRFVVAAIVKGAVEARTGRHAIRGLRYLFVLDELNRFAPRNSTDPITQFLEEVASERRSQGIILLGAQQLASQVSMKIIENSSIRSLGRTGPAELQDRVWQAWNTSARRQASVLRPEEKLIMQPTFRQPMFIKVPFPAWAMRREDIAAPQLSQTPEV
ncbi:ATP-binding protein [Candidatus Poribacteria bacterium]|nr:ATP-binding protein [Candidatus Poribacteria bacterium]